ncbi:nuclear transport factor 2 family protein [Govanella unica]|uniref:Nuclear transport factor 2 family protein n=1 Tax=Govanella unica TaxID=2975056 RepID=A0A9X3TXF7_9PROT|nr:nuclear transport factor 2 family protein [Govania unica]MDA5193465.1 nuclear transport factor 2 family protein [Govania unica]
MMKSKGLLLAILIAASLFAKPVLAADNAKILTDMFAWWNKAYASDSGFTQQDFARYYTPDAVIYMNGEKRAKGLAAITRHFQTMRDDAEKVIVWLPFQESFVSGDRVFTYHMITAVAKGEQSCWHVMGYAVIKGQRVSELNFVSISDEQQSACPALS